MFLKPSFIRRFKAMINILLANLIDLRFRLIPIRIFTYDIKITRHGIILKPIERSLRSAEYLTVDGMNEMGQW
jgi:hypothetical protein